MIYVSIDIETTGLDRDNDQIIEFGAIMEDTKNPKSFEDSFKFHKYIEHDRYSGGAYALALNQRIFKILAGNGNGNDDIILPDKLGYEFNNWLNSYCSVYGKFSVAGKNFRDFDYEYLKRLSVWNDWIKIERRIIDPAVLFWNPLIDDKLPSQDECLVRAGIDGKVEHTALGDAWQVIQLLRTKYVTQE